MNRGPASLPARNDLRVVQRLRQGCPRPCS